MKWIFELLSRNVKTENNDFWWVWLKTAALCALHNSDLLCTYHMIVSVEAEQWDLLSVSDNKYQGTVHQSLKQVLHSPYDKL